MSELSLNERVREALQSLWHAERVCLAKRQECEAVEAEREATADRYREAHRAWALADEEQGRARQRRRELAEQADEETP